MPAFTLAAENSEINVDATAVPAAALGLVAARAVAAARVIAAPEPLYLRAPDVTMPAAPKRVGT